MAIGVLQALKFYTDHLAVHRKVLVTNVSYTSFSVAHRLFDLTLTTYT